MTSSLLANRAELKRQTLFWSFRHPSQIGAKGRWWDIYIRECIWAPEVILWRELQGGSIAGERICIAGVGRSGHSRSFWPSWPRSWPRSRSWPGSFSHQWPSWPESCWCSPNHRIDLRPLSKSCNFSLKRQLLRGKKWQKSLNLECCSPSLTSRSGMGQVVGQELQSENKTLSRFMSSVKWFKIKETLCLQLVYTIFNLKSIQS